MGRSRLLVEAKDATFETSAAAEPGRNRIATSGLVWLAALLSFAVCAELTARIDDYLRSGVPLLSNLDAVGSLRGPSGGIIRGRPLGHFKKWHLDENGFRTVAGASRADPACGRVY